MQALSYASKSRNGIIFNLVGNLERYEFYQLDFQFALISDVTTPSKESLNKEYQSKLKNLFLLGRRPAETNRGDDQVMPNIRSRDESSHTEELNCKLPH